MGPIKSGQCSLIVKEHHLQPHHTRVGVQVNLTCQFRCVYTHINAHT